ncbi:telomere binding protein [Pleurotus pulmonarius]|nr:telomere binding protein [Pleurotus pulmonarius]KAF4608737.1 telomere binding protein [Pleurotus pulmonarius]
MAPDESATNGLDQVRDIIQRLQAPVPDLPTVLALLSAPLAALGLLPPRFRGHNQNALPEGAFKLGRHIPSIQEAILLKIVPTWEQVLQENDALLLADQYFCPDSFWCATDEAGHVALLAYSTLLSTPLNAYSLRLLTRLTREYPIDRLFQAVFVLKGSKSALSTHEYQKRSIQWEDCVQNIISVPAKAANAALASKIAVPELLEHGAYLNNLCIRCEQLIYSLSAVSSNSNNVASVAYLLGKLANVGVFPSTRPTSRSQPSFFLSTLSSIRGNLKAVHGPQYANVWHEILDQLPSISTTQSILTSLFSSLSVNFDADPGVGPNSRVKAEASLLLGIVGHLGEARGELWDSVASITLNRRWSEWHARILVCWVAGAQSENVDDATIGAWLSTVVDVWSSPDHVKYSLLSQHQYLTSLLLFTISYLPPPSSHLSSIGLSPTFISGVGTYIAHNDQAVRLCGMLAAEMVAHRTGRELTFGDWDDDGPGKAWARSLRQKLQFRDIDAPLNEDEGDISVPTSTGQTPTQITEGRTTQKSTIVLATESGYDSDDSLVGYQSDASSRSASPTPSELAEIEKEPTLNVGVKKVARPVYLAQLGELLRSQAGTQGKDDPHHADKIEMALSCAEELIRRKRNYGTELEENAVNLVYALISLQDNYDLDDFENKRQAALNALVSCCPRKAAPCIIEQFFINQYAISQRYVMLNAMAIGARELASLPVPPSASHVSADRATFPSKLLPTHLHSKYLTAGDTNQIQQITDSLSRVAIDKSKSDDGEKIPEIARERRLRINQSSKITTVESSKKNAQFPWLNASPTKDTTFTEVAAEFFIMPFLNRFWVFIRDEQTREERTAHLSGRARYHGSGTGLVLNPIVLSHFLSTMTVLVHAAQNAPEWLAIIAPEALEFALTVGTRPISLPDDDDERIAEPGQSPEEAARNKEASVLSASLELALIVLDGAKEVDDGRSLGLEHTGLLVGTGEWAGTLFARLESGMKAEGGGGAQEMKLRRAAAGVLLKVDEITSKWRRSMIDSANI